MRRPEGKESLEGFPWLQQLGLCAPNTGAASSITGRGTKIPHLLVFTC